MPLKVAQGRQYKVAFIVNSYPVISEPFIMNAAVGLLRSGCAVDVIALSGTAEHSTVRHRIQDELEQAAHIISPRFRLSRRARLLKMPDALRRVSATFGWCALRGLDPLIFGIKVFGLQPLYWAEALAASPAYDIVHCQFATLAPFALNLRRAGFLRGRVVVHFRGYDISMHVQKEGIEVYDRVFDEADWFVANCRFFRDRAISLGCDAARIDIVPSGSDLEIFPFSPRSWPEDGVVRLLGVGRLVEKKGFAVAIEAVRLLRSMGRAVTLRIIGGGPLRSALQSAIRERELTGIVELAGPKPHHEIAEELAAAHIVIAPSLTAENGDQDAPVNSLKEAMATGAPVVASRHGGIPELVEDGVSGFLVAEGDPAQLAGRIDHLIARHDLWPMMGREGHKKVTREFSVAVANGKLLGVYANALSTQSNPFEARRAPWLMIPNQIRA